VLADLKWLWTVENAADAIGRRIYQRTMRPQYYCSGKAMLQSQCNLRFLIRGYRSFYGRLLLTSHPYNTLYLIAGFLSSTFSCILWWQTWLIGRYMIRTHTSISAGSSTDRTLLRKLGQSQMDIMLDGYIAQTLAPFCTEKYLKIFMSSLDKQRGSLLVFNNQWIVARPTTTQQEKQRWASTKPKPGNYSNARANKIRANFSPPEVYPTASRPLPMSPLVNSDYAADTVYEIFDRKVDLRMGTVVPQPSAIGLSKKTGVLSPTFFIQSDGTLGIPYEFPFTEQCPLHNATALAPTVLKREHQSARIRLRVSTSSFSRSPARRALGKSQCTVCIRSLMLFILFSRFSCSGPGMNSSTTISG
jgi:hypothetical protein